MPRYVSARLRRAAEGQSCVRCGAQDDTVCLSHLPGWETGVGAGVAQKTHDWCGADLCKDCHDYVDGPEGRKDHATRMRVLCRTLERRFEQGVINTIG